MQLKKINLLAISILFAFISFAGAARFHGCYYFLTISAIVAIVTNLTNLAPSLRSNLRISFFLLCAYSFILIYSGLSIYHTNSTSLAQILLGNINLPLLFLAGCLTFRIDQKLPPNNRIKFHNIAKLIAYYYCAGAVWSSLYVSLTQWAIDEPTIISTIRPSELLYSIGICIFSTIFVSKYALKASIYSSPRKITAFSVIFLCGSIANLFLAYFVFKGLTSLVAAAALFSVIAINSIFKYKIFSHGSKVTYAIVAFIGLWIVLFYAKEAILRYIFYPFISGNPLNGRASLILSSIDSLRSTPLVGHSANLQRYQGIWTHNFYLDTILQHGYLACVIIVTFISYFLFNLRLSATAKLVKTGLYLISFSLFIGSLIQPVEFSDGIAFQLSFFVLGSMAGIIYADSTNKIEPMDNAN